MALSWNLSGFGSHRIEAIIAIAIAVAVAVAMHSVLPSWIKCLVWGIRERVETGRTEEEGDDMAVLSTQPCSCAVRMEVLTAHALIRVKAMAYEFACLEDALG